MAESRSDPGTLNIVIQNLVKAAAESKEIEDVKEVVLFPKDEFKQAVHCFIFKRVIQPTAEPESKTVIAPQNKFIFAYAIKDASTKTNTASLYSLEEALPELTKLAEEHQAILYAPLALCRHAAKLQLSFTQLHHMVFLELNGVDKYLNIYDFLGQLKDINLREGVYMCILRLGIALYPDKLADLEKSTYQYRGWHMLDIQKHLHLCTKYVGASFKSIIKVGDTSALKQINIVPEEVEAQPNLSTPTPLRDECVEKDGEDDVQLYEEAVKLHRKERFGLGTPMMFAPASPAKQTSGAQGALGQAVQKTPSSP